MKQVDGFRDRFTKAIGSTRYLRLGEMNIPADQPELGVSRDAIVPRTTHAGKNVAAKV